MININHHKDTKVTEETREIYNNISKEIIGAAFEVHRVLGPGLLESAYEESLCYELKLSNLNIKQVYFFVFLVWLW